MLRFSFYRVIGFIGLLVMLVLISTKQAAYGRPITQITVAESSVVIDWVSPEQPIYKDGSAATGFTVAQTPGRPQLPQVSFPVAIPAGATARLSVQPGDSQPLVLNRPFELAPQPQGILTNEQALPIGGGFEPASADLTFEPTWVTFEEVGTMAGVRLGNITVHPVLPADWPGVSDQVQLLESATITLDFVGADPMLNKNNRQAIESTLVDQLLTNQVVNPVHLNPTRPTAQRSRQANTSSAIIKTSGEPGMVKVSYDQLKSAGFPVDSTELGLLQLFALDTELSWELQGSGSDQDRLEAGESIVFYAPGRHSRWQVEEAFRLVAGAEAGQKIGTVSADPSGLTVTSPVVTAWAEEDLFYTPHCLCGDQPLGHDGDRWMWLDLKRPNKETASFVVETPSANTNATATLTLYLIGNTALTRPNDHRLAVSLNGTYLDDVVWDGKTAFTAELNVPAGLLSATNTVDLELKDTGGLLDGVWLDAASITHERNADAVVANKQLQIQTAGTLSRYQVGVAQSAGVRVYDVTDSLAPIRLTGITASGDSIEIGSTTESLQTIQIVQTAAYQRPSEIYMAPDLLTEQTSGGDIVMIVPAELRDELTPLISHRTNQGYTVVVEEVERIFDTFGHGEPNPIAIQAFLKDGWERWENQPSMVLLAGDGHYDPRNNLGQSAPVLIPPFLLDVDPWMGETAADNRFVTFDGPDDRLPEMALGRLPANNPAELREMVTKIIDFETARPEGDWSGRFTFVADNADSAGDFVAQIQGIIKQFFPAPWKSKRFFLTTDQTDPAPLIAQIKTAWNSGTGIVMFMGHASIHQWGAEQLFHIDSVAELNNGSKLPMVMQMSCFTGSFHYPDFDGVDETLMRHGTGGAIGIWGSTGLGVSTGHDVLAEGFLQTYLEPQKQASLGANQTLGAATLAGKAELALSRSDHLDLLDTFTLFGDPATTLEFVTPNEDYDVYLPLIVR